MVLVHPLKIKDLDVTTCTQTWDAFGNCPLLRRYASNC